jgi:hypothetical protein
LGFGPVGNDPAEDNRLGGIEVVVMSDNSGEDLGWPSSWGLGRGIFEC